MGQEPKPRTDQFDNIERLYVHPPQTEGVRVLTPHGAMRSRRWRFWLGLFELATGLLTGWVTAANAQVIIAQIQDMEASNVRPSEGWIPGIIAVVVGFSMISIAGVATGIWNLVTLERTVRSPLIAAIVVSAVSVVLTMVFIGGSPLDPVKVGWVFLHAVVSVWTIGILRLKKVPTP